MDLIYANADREDVGVMKDYVFDLAFGIDENDFECKIAKNKHCCLYDYYLYIEGKEYGGIIDDVGVDTEKDEVIYSGRTWHGILNSKILEPDSGKDYLVVSGEANSVLSSLIDRMGLSDLFKASTENSGITISSYKMNRYIAGYDGIRKMLASSDAKLNLVFKNGFVVLSAKPIVDYSEEEQFDASQIEIKVLKKYNPMNHVICLGKGELAEREVIHIYADESGNIVSNQIFQGISEVCGVYENTNAESSEELRQGGIDMIKESWTSHEFEFNFNADDESYDIGDIVSASEHVTGITIAADIAKKMVIIKKGELTISYECGNQNVILLPDKKPTINNDSFLPSVSAILDFAFLDSLILE